MIRGSENPLLFASSTIFPGAKALDCIHQCDIDLRTRNVPATEVADVLRSLLVFVTRPVTEDIRDDFVSFVHNCFAAFPKDLHDVSEAFLKSAYSTIRCLDCTIFMEIALAEAGEVVSKEFVEKTLHEFELFVKNVCL